MCRIELSKRTAKQCGQRVQEALAKRSGIYLHMERSEFLILSQRRLSIITTEMAAEAIRSAVTRPSLLQGSAAFLRAAAAFVTACFVDISLCAYS